MPGSESIMGQKSWVWATFSKVTTKLTGSELVPSKAGLGLLVLGAKLEENKFVSLTLLTH